MPSVRKGPRAMWGRLGLKVIAANPVKTVLPDGTAQTALLALKGQRAIVAMLVPQVQKEMQAKYRLAQFYSSKVVVLAQAGLARSYRQHP